MAAPPIHYWYRQMKATIRTAVPTIIVLVLGTRFAVAEPSISSYSGDPRNGSTVVLSGSSFGGFGGEIVSWDDFESQAVGAPIHGSKATIGGQWTTQFGYSGSGAAFDNRRAHSGSNAALLDWSIDANTIRAFGWAGRGPYTRLFISYWRYMQGNYVAGDGNHKQFYLFGTNSDRPQLMPLIPAGTKIWGIYNNVGDSSLSWSERNNINTLGWNYDNTRDKFQRWDFWIELNDVNVPNGTVKAWLDGALGIENYKYNTRRVEGAFDDFRLGHMAQGFTDTAKAWFDDVYIATTQARVELCDAPTWSTCKMRAIQVVDSARWTTSQIAFQYRTGGLTTGGTAYVYVVDANGSVNEIGFPINGAEAAAPRPPSGVVVE